MYVSTTSFHATLISLINLRIRTLLSEIELLFNTTAVVGYPGLKHIPETDGEKDFTPVIGKAVELGGWEEDKQFTGINGGTEPMTGFAHNIVMDVVDKLIKAVKDGSLKHIFLVGGCDGANKVRTITQNL